MKTLAYKMIGPIEIKLVARDQYNDYSVIYDHFLVVNGQEVYAGTNESHAFHAFNRAADYAAQYVASSP